MKIRYMLRAVGSGSRPITREAALELLRSMPHRWRGGNKETGQGPRGLRTAELVRGKLYIHVDAWQLEAETLVADGGR